MWKFIKHEWKYWLSSPMTWIFLFINTMLMMGAVSSDNVNIGGGVGSVHKNAPYVIQNYYGVMSLICLLMTTAFMNASANRDFAHGMYQFVFSSPIKKSHYYFGKFIGATSIAILPLLGVSLGSLIGPLMPWAQPERYCPVLFDGHLQGLITFGIPNTIIAAVLLYVLSIIFRSNIVSFVGAMLILVLYAVSVGFTRDIEKEWLANLLDPFGFYPEKIVAKYMTVDEKNLHAVPLAGAFLINRLIWVGFSFLILVAAYFKFSFSTKNEKVKKEKKTVKEDVSLPTTTTVFSATQANKFSFSALWYLIRFETKAIIKNPTFIIIIILGLLNLVASLASFSGGYGVDQYPVTYDVIDSIKGSFYLFLVAIITFYTGVLVWKERDAKINEIKDATPVQTSLLFLSKVVALVAAIALVLGCTIVLGIITQTLFGYHRYQLDIYFKSLLVIDLMSFSFLVVIALFFHYFINNRYIAYFAFVAFVILNQFIWGVFQISTNMVKFGSTPRVTYSDMNGFGPFILSQVWFNIYWLAFSVLIGFIIFAFYIRGKETGFGHRLAQAKSLLSKKKMAIGFSALVFVLCASFVYYNTKVLNKYDSEKETENKQVEYEKTYKKYQHIVQPRFYKYKYTIDLMPYQRSMTASVQAWAKNISNQPISELHFTMPQIPDTVIITINGSKLKLNDNRLSYRIYTLDKPLQPNDSISMQFDLSKTTKGFENEVSFTQLTQNGTFFNNRDIMPTFGYEGGNEMTDKNKRVKYKLPTRLRMAKLNENNWAERANTYISTDADWVDVTTTISTAPDQIAIAPGSLLKSWEANGKKYFIYQLDQKSLDFYSFISAKYEVARKKWNGIDLEVYYVKEHDYNVPNMLKSLEKSMDYYTRNYGKYYHKQCRIIEFPRYASFAQAFPGTMPYSESIGFITDLRKVTKEDIDLVFYVVAHEMGHQYWAHQLIGPDMQGSEMMSEGFAQYSALMVMQQEYGRDRMQKFLKYEMDGYLRGRSTEFEAERPLMKTEHQSYIHYQKASVVMYYLKEMIGEDKVDMALHSLLDSFAYKQAPYPTSLSAIRAFRKVTPDSLQYLIDDMFQNITLFSNRTTEAKYKKVGNEYEVTLTTTSEKFSADSLGKEKAVPLADYIDVGIFSEPISKNNLGKPLLLQRFKLTKKDNVFTFRVKEKPYQAGIDPYNYLIDRLPEDNLKRVGVYGESL
ncbi:MAG TPA: M1 family aminopeptidase [Bacteroidia bacterium]|nr:M1 family aminopeptidase [Bacteroidia bacterium]